MVEFYEKNIKPRENEFDIIIEMKLFNDPEAYILYRYKDDYIEVVSIKGMRPPIVVDPEGEDGLKSLYFWAIEETYPPLRPMLDVFYKSYGLDYYEPLLLIKETKGKRATNKITYDFIKFNFQPNPLYPDSKSNK